MSLEREKPLLLKKKIKALEAQIEQKNSLLTSIKQTEYINDEKIKGLKLQNDAKLKNINQSIYKLRQENSLLKSTKPSKYYLPPLSKTPILKHNGSRNVSAGPRLQKSFRNEEVSGVEEKAKIENSNEDNAKGLDVSVLTKQLDFLKHENERLKFKNKQINDKFHSELTNKEREILELRRLKIDLGVLNEKFEILSRKNLHKDKTQEVHNDVFPLQRMTNDAIIFMNKRILDLGKAIDLKTNENDKLKEEINHYKLKARILFAEKKKNLEKKEGINQECQCVVEEDNNNDEKLKKNNEKDIIFNNETNIENENEVKNENIIQNINNNIESLANDNGVQSYDKKIGEGKEDKQKNCGEMHDFSFFYF